MREREREREREQAGEGQKEKERKYPKQAPCCQHRTRCGAWTQEPWDHDLSWNQVSDAKLTEQPRCPSNEFSKMCAWRFFPTIRNSENRHKKIIKYIKIYLSYDILCSLKMIWLYVDLERHPWYGAKVLKKGGIQSLHILCFHFSEKIYI